MDEEIMATALSVLMLGILAVRVAFWIATYRAVFVGVLTAWVLWLG
jgi:hypothetical protein